MANIEKTINTAKSFKKTADTCWKHGTYFEETAQNVSYFCNDVLELLKEQLWIPVSERKPKSMANKVIVYLEHEDFTPMIGYGHFERYQGEEMWYDLEHGEQFSKHGYTVTYWMPMPKSPDGKTLNLC